MPDYMVDLTIPMQHVSKPQHLSHKDSYGRRHDVGIVIRTLAPLLMDAPRSGQPPSNLPPTSLQPPSNLPPADTHESRD